MIHVRRRNTWLLGWLLLGVWVLSACGAPAAMDRSGTSLAAPAQPASTTTTGRSLTVFAAASLSEAFTEIGQQFEERTGTTITFNFAGSQQLAQQLAQGAPADVFASANAREMDHAIEAGAVVSGTQQAFVRNKLVVIVPKTNPAQIGSLHDLARNGVKLDLAAEQVPVGQYTQRVLAKLSADPAYGADYAAAVNANVVSLEENVKAVVTKVSLGEADAGVVYVSDVTPGVANQLAMIAIPDQVNEIATYPIAITSAPPAGAELAQAFVAFVRSADGQAILARYNFTPLGAP